MMRLDGSALVVACAECSEGRVLQGVAAALVRDLQAEGMALPCSVTPGCTGRLEPQPQMPVPLAQRPPATEHGRHAWSCPSCRTPLEFDYLYGFPGSAERCACPRCGADVAAAARREWPRGPDGAQPMNLRVTALLGESPRAAPLRGLEERAADLLVVER